MSLLAGTTIGFLLFLLFTSLALAAPPASSSSAAAAAASTPLFPPTLQRTCAPDKSSVCCVVASNSSTTTTTTTSTRSIPSPVRGQNDGDDTGDNGGEEDEGAGRNETTFVVTPLTVHSCRLKEAGVDCDDLATAACCRVIHVVSYLPSLRI
ncbi:hypothetical protein D0865_13497 [Hortaea werneckii]|uniref:Hydrophobin n=1 Tax=Hortaea werneckii TaxID=91943 RepID=A0A3M7BC23_HORWE|nr:hypothetical protein D0865_13497 [Hortaea werneckii]